MSSTSGIKFVATNATATSAILDPRELLLMAENLEKKVDAAAEEFAEDILEESERLQNALEMVTKRASDMVIIKNQAHQLTSMMRSLYARWVKPTPCAPVPVTNFPFARLSTASPTNDPAT